MSRTKVSFANTRVRFQRLCDAKLFGGWIRSLALESAVVSVNVPIRVAAGQEFRFEAIGTGADAVFEGVLVSENRGLLKIKVKSPLQIVRSSEEARVQTSSIPAELKLLESLEPPRNAVLLDVSRSGLGLRVARPVPQGSLVRVSFQNSQPRFECDGEVRYCKADGGSFRVGLRIVQMDRVSAIVVEKLFDQRRAAA